MVVGRERRNIYYRYLAFVLTSLITHSLRWFERGLTIGKAKPLYSSCAASLVLSSYVLIGLLQCGSQLILLKPGGFALIVYHHRRCIQLNHTIAFLSNGRKYVYLHTHPHTIYILIGYAKPEMLKMTHTIIV